jgi:outer membrane lipoprotein carrier protein
VSLFCFLALLAPTPAAPEPVDLLKLLKGVEDRYNRVRSLQVGFEQSQSGRGRILRVESGQLSMQKPGKMRWDYHSPQGKWFLSDGKFLYYYSPDSGHVQRARVNQSEDLRAPLGFLMGRLDFRRDFKEFRTTREGEKVYLVAAPKSEKSAFREVAFLVTPDYRVDLLRVTANDGSLMTYRLNGEKLNPTLSAKLFEFRLPSGAQLVDDEEPER